MILAGIGHLTFLRGEFQAQVPDWFPMNKDLVVILSGVVELLLGIGMVFLTKHQVKVGMLLAVFYLLIFPGNIAQYTNHVDAFSLDTDQKRLTRLFFQPVLILWALWSTGALKHLVSEYRIKKQMASKKLYDFEATTIKGETVSLEKYKGKVILVVNTASKCGLTPQYEGLEKIYEKYKDKGLVVLGFPCNQFGSQEPGNANDIQEFCQINYGVSFPMFSKIDVNGEHAHPIFVYLKSKLRSIIGKNIKWNFTKFLIDKNGEPVRRFSPTTKPENIEPAIQKLL